MYSLEELRKQNREIADLCDVLSVLAEHESLRSNPVVCELAARFHERVWMHLVFEDNTVYSELARHPDAEISEIAVRFHDSAREVKLRFGRYVQRWCQPQVSPAEHAAFVAESRAIFELIRERVTFEDEEMLPLVAAHQAL